MKMNTLRRVVIPADTLAQLFILGPNLKSGKDSLLYIADIKDVKELGTIEVIVEEMQKSSNASGPFRVVYFKLDHDSIPSRASVVFDFPIFELPSCLVRRIARFAVF